jgi:Aspartyl/Asparaginyl beta-hydroxylase
MKYTWSKDEISIADELTSLAPKLREEFLNHHTDFFTTFTGGTPYHSANPLAILDAEEKTVWKVEGLRYALPEQRIEKNLFLDSSLSNNFPTATQLTKKYLSHCGCSGYSILEGGGVIKPHMDIENRLHKTVRIHIPLIIPEGEIIFRVGQYQFDWSELFGFDNGILHSAYNKAVQRRLIYIIDITRSFLGIPPFKQSVS